MLRFQKWPLSGALGNTAEYGRKIITAEFLENLEAAISFQWFPHVNGYWKILASRNNLEVYNVWFLIYLVKSPSTKVITATVFFLQFNFVIILCWYYKKQNPWSCPGTIAVKDWATVTRHYQIWHKACS